MSLCSMFFRREEEEGEEEETAFIDQRAVAAGKNPTRLSFFFLIALFIQTHFHE